MIEEILVIKDTIPIYFYNRKPDEQLSEDWYLLQSGFFVALTQFASELGDEKLKYIVMENKIYAFDEVSRILLIISESEQISDLLLNQLKSVIKNTSIFLTELLNKYKLTDKTIAVVKDTEALTNDFTLYLKTRGLIEDESGSHPYVRSELQKFIFKTIGYIPGKCNIGPAERLRRLINGIVGLVFAIVGAFFIFFLELPAWTTFFLIIPLSAWFSGLYMYFFRFCAINAVRKKYNLK